MTASSVETSEVQHVAVGWELLVPAGGNYSVRIPHFPTVPFVDDPYGEPQADWVLRSLWLDSPGQRHVLYSLYDYASERHVVKSAPGHLLSGTLLENVRIITREPQFYVEVTNLSACEVQVYGALVFGRLPTRSGPRPLPLK